MIFVMTIVAMLLLSVCIADRYKVSVGDGIALSGSVTILLLYVLAFFRGMKLIGVIGLVFVVVVFRLKKYVLDPLLVMFVVGVAAVTLLTGSRFFPGGMILISGHLMPNSFFI